MLYYCGCFYKKDTSAPWNTIVNLGMIKDVIVDRPQCPVCGFLQMTFTKKDTEKRFLYEMMKQEVAQERTGNMEEHLFRTEVLKDLCAVEVDE